MVHPITITTLSLFTKLAIALTPLTSTCCTLAPVTVTVDNVLDVLWLESLFPPLIVISSVERYEAPEFGL